MPAWREATGPGLGLPSLDNPPLVGPFALRLKRPSFAADAYGRVLDREAAHRYPFAVAIERKITFPLLLSEDELKLLQLLAERDGLDASEYVRSVIRMMPSTNAPTIAQVTRLGATLRSLSLAGRVDVAKVFEAHTDALKAMTDVEPTEKKKKAT